MMAKKKPGLRKQFVEMTLESMALDLIRIKDTLKPVDKLNETLQQLQPTMNQLLGELRAVRILLDEKKQYAHMDKPRKNLDDLRPIPEGLGLPRL